MRALVQASIIMIAPLNVFPHRKPLWDENGEWLERDPESSKALNRILCRPVTQMWMEAPEARARKGQVGTGAHACKSKGE